MKINNVSTREKVLGKSKDISIDVAQSQVKFIQGKVLTVIEAAITDKSQLKAIKDLINTIFSNQLMYIYQLGYPGVDMMTEDKAESIMSDVPYTRSDTLIY